MTAETTTASATRVLAEFVAQATYDDLPAEVREAAKRYILDSLGNMIAGSRIEPAQIMLQMYAELGGKPEATIMATGQKVPCLHAGYVNAALNNMLDFDDTYRYSSHPGATIIPPALAVAEKLGASGKEMINAVVLGYEVSLRVGEATRPTPEHFEQIWGMSSWQIFGAVTVAAKLLQLDVEGVATAFGHTGMHAPVPFIRKMGLDPAERPFCWLKNNFGWAVMGGILSAELASRGFHGNKNIFDGPKGFWRMMGSDRCNYERLTGGLGSEYLVLGTAIKPYPSCHRIHTTIDALLDVMGQGQIDPQKVRAVTIRSTKGLCDGLGIRNPADIIDTQFAVPPLVALVLAGHSHSQTIAFEHLHDPLVQDLIAKIQIEIDPDSERGYFEARQMPSTVIVEMADGTRFEAKHSLAKGEPEDPLSQAEIEEKFRSQTVPLVGEGRAAHILGTVRRLEEVEDARDIAGA